MKVSRAEAEENRERIIDVASELFRQHGFDGIGIADLMKTAGLTHGGFYGNFKSKEDLAARACAKAFVASQQRWEAIADGDAEDPLVAIVAHYVSKRHRDRPATGCMLATLAPEAARHGKPVQAAFTAGIKAYVDILARLVPGRSAAARRQRALSALAEMVGAIVLARATEDAALSDELLGATAAHLASA
jgi:TetR/AcrR family transcriptional repressor of nem operon